MKVIKSGFCAVALVVSSQSVIAAPFAYEARSLGMGNIGVATADIATAPFMNPAMLSFQKADDDFSLLLGGGVFISDNDGMIDSIDQFQAANAAYDAAIAVPDPIAAAAAIVDMQTIAAQLSNKTIEPEVAAAVAVGVSGETYSMAVSARTDAVITAGVTLDLLDITNTASNRLNLFGLRTTEVGVSIARNFEVMGSKLSIGITPKIVNVEALQFSEPLSSVSTGTSDLVDHAVQELGDFTTLDIGIVLELSRNMQLGVTAKNLIEEEMLFPGSPVPLNFETQLSAGIAYSNEFITVGADIDLTEDDLTVKKIMSVGMEIDIFDIVQARVGMMKNVADGISAEEKKPLYTAGVGLWLGFNLDIAAIKGEGDSVGAFAQAGFKF